MGHCPPGDGLGVMASGGGRVGFAGLGSCPVPAFIGWASLRLPTQQMAGPETGSWLLAGQVRLRGCAVKLVRKGLTSAWLGGFSEP